jgi:hypothetical protein
VRRRTSSPRSYVCWRHSRRRKATSRIGVGDGISDDDRDPQRREISVKAPAAR